MQEGEVMLAQQQPQSRWTAFVERWDGRLERFRQSIDPYSDGPERRIKPWTVAALSVGLIVLAALIGFGGWWIYDHHKWALLWPLLKVGKLFAVGVAIVVAIFFGGNLTKKPQIEQPQNGDAAGLKG
jgi:fatty acid desaturase